MARVPRLVRISHHTVIFCALTFVVLFTATSCFENLHEPPLDKSGWRRMPTPTGENLNGVWGLESGELFAVGDNGTILRYDGSSWSIMNSGTTVDLNDVWAGGADNAVATGDDGVILYYDGTGWAPMVSGTTMPVGRIWAVAIEPFPSQLPFVAWAVGGGPPGTILFFDGRVWQPIDTGGSEDLIDIAGWSQLVDVGSPRIAVVGANGSVRFFDGASWSGSDTGINEDLVAVYGAFPNNVYAIGRDGTVIQNNGRFTPGAPTASWRTVGRVEGTGLSDIAARSYNDLFLAGAGGQISSFDRREFTDMRTPTGASLSALWSDERVVFAVGDNGTILRYSRRAWNRPCPINVTVTATPGTRPVISWSPPCPVSKIVFEDDYRVAQWFFETDGNLIYPGVEYGTAPAGAVERRPTGIPLPKEGIYRVSLVWRDRDTEIVVGVWNLSTSSNSSTSGGPVELQPVADPDPFPDARVTHFQRLVPTGTGVDIFAFDRMAEVFSDGWRSTLDPAEEELALDVRPAIVEVLERDPDTGEIRLVVLTNVRVAELPSGGGAVVWDILPEE